MKICKKCHKQYELCDFVSKGKERLYCVYCREKHVQRVTKSRLRKQAIVYEYKRQKGCCVCGVSEPIILDFHHTDPNVKDDTIANLFVNNAPIQKIFSEIEKCVVICANHHRMLHAGMLSI